MSKVPSASEQSKTVDFHVAEIQSALMRARGAIFDVATAIRGAKDELGEESVNQEVAVRLGMSKGTLSKWLKIASSDFLIANKDAVPSTFTGLYNITQLEAQYRQAYSKEADQKLIQLVEQGKINPSSEIDDIKGLLEQIKERQKQKAKKDREKALLSLSSATVQIEQPSETLEGLIAAGRRFRTIVLLLDNERASRWGDEAVLESGIADEFPLQDLRAVSVAEPVQLFVVGLANMVQTALKITAAFGFAFRGLYLGQTKHDGLALCRTNPLVVRGERGLGKQSDFPPEIHPPTLDGVLGYSEAVGGIDRLLVFGTTARPGWTSVA